MHASFVGSHGTSGVTVGARLRVSKLRGLPRRGFLQGASGQAERGGVGDLLHLGKIHIQARPLIAESLPRDDFSPLLGESGDGLQFFGGELPCRHDVAVLEVRKVSRDESWTTILTKPLCAAKGVLHSEMTFACNSRCILLASSRIIGKRSRETAFRESGYPRTHGQNQG